VNKIIASLFLMTAGSLLISLPAYCSSRQQLQSQRFQVERHPYGKEEDDNYYTALFFKVAYDAGVVRGVATKSGFQEKTSKFLGVQKKKIKECAKKELHEEDKNWINRSKRTIAKTIVYLGSSYTAQAVLEVVRDAVVVSAIEACCSERFLIEDRIEHNVIVEGGGRILTELYNSLFGTGGLVGITLNRDGLCASVVHRLIKELID